MTLDSISVPFLGNTSSQTDRAESTDTDETTDAERSQMRGIEETQEHSQSTSANTSTNANDDISMETESSQTDQTQAVSAGYTSSHDRIAHNDAWDRNRNEDEASRENIASKQENMMENLHDRLTTMRDGFLER